ncbi:carbonic anhydrase [Brevibacterium sp. 50QC2O2]|uniref:carbonic anhydrase n=1 Tax=unclassified Brevibacterium TaxID=2614124 RepID=UPI00211C63BC|nr:carbonic anhydrase [Brevibacterium sp. 91QC2O2]MCQ9387431.1 carbonic anhydrase [Brevibacterium sp. 50QC2O2]
MSTIPPLKSDHNTPRKVLERLLQGNERFVNNTPEHPNQDAARKHALTGGQHPFATLFGCADSRVAAEMIFDVGLGDMFVVRTAGQVTDAVTLGSLEYGAVSVGTPLLIVLGHDSCGAVTAAIESYDSGTTPEGFVADIVARLLPTVVESRKAGHQDVNSTVALNTINTARMLYSRSPVLARQVDAGKLIILGMTYSLDDGHVHIVERIGATAPTD